MLKAKRADFASLPDEDFDAPLGVATGAGAVFGCTGGVMEAALRTAYEFATGQPVGKLEFEQIRGMQGIKEGSITIKGREIRFAAAHGGANIRKLIEQKEKYHFVEMMACPGGCVGGGGQPIYSDPDTLRKRSEAIYAADASCALRKSHENPVVKEIYEKYLGHPLSEKAEKLLHTTYSKRDRF
jgi:NADH-quinone oxidoreductase subunit G